MNESWRETNRLLPPSTPRHAGPLEDTLNTTAAMNTQHSLLATPSQAVRPDGDLTDTQKHGTAVHQDNQSLLNLLFNIAEDQARKGGL